MEFLSEVQEAVEDTAWMALKYLDNEEYLTLYIVGQKIMICNMIYGIRRKI